MLDKTLINLLKPSKDLTLEEISSDVEKYINIYEKELKPELDSNENAVGISAIQVGIPKNMFVIRNVLKDTIYINASFTQAFSSKGISKKNKIEESCLSFPNIYCLIDRYEKIFINGYILDLENKSINKIKPNTILKGFEAIVFQHEYDHTKGVTILQKGEKLLINTKNKDKDLNLIYQLLDIDDYIIDNEEKTIFKGVDYKLKSEEHYVIGVKNNK